MNAKTLKDLFLTELADMYDAELRAQTPQMSAPRQFNHPLERSSHK